MTDSKFVLPLDRPMIFFDLETTGLLSEIDRIIEISLIKIMPSGERIEYTQRFNPEIRIPMESTAVHGITNDQLTGEPRFIDKAPYIFGLFADADLAGYSIGRLDIPVLTKEFERAGLKYSAETRRVIDVNAIFREKERRDLTAAYKFFCKKDLAGAHGAKADNEATLEVFLAQLDRYPDLPKNAEGLHAFCHKPDPICVDKRGRLIWRDGEAFFNFGKHRYKALTEVARTDRDYLDWVLQKADFDPEFVEICANAKRGIFPKRAPLPTAAQTAPSACLDPDKPTATVQTELPLR
jgi:DNA polymerase-3 subunit epsilon